jgi:hypothetical protein
MWLATIKFARCFASRFSFAGEPDAVDIQSYAAAAMFIAWVIVRLACEIRLPKRSTKGGRNYVITLGIPTTYTRSVSASAAEVESKPKAEARKALCESCVYSHIAQGYEPEEQLIMCGYAFPSRQLYFKVRDCTDFKPKRDCKVGPGHGTAVIEIQLEECNAAFPLR